MRAVELKYIVVRDRAMDQGKIHIDRFKNLAVTTFNQGPMRVHPCVKVIIGCVEALKLAKIKFVWT